MRVCESVGTLIKEKLVCVMRCYIWCDAWCTTMSVHLTIIIIMHCVLCPTTQKTNILTTLIQQKKLRVVNIIEGDLPYNNRTTPTLTMNTHNTSMTSQYRMICKQAAL